MFCSPVYKVRLTFLVKIFCLQIANTFVADIFFFKCYGAKVTGHSPASNCPHENRAAPVQVKNSLLLKCSALLFAKCAHFLLLPYLTVIYLLVAVSMKTELRLFRSKTVGSYNVLLSCLQSADRHSLLFGPMFVDNFSRQILLVIQPSAFLTTWAGF